MADRRPIAFRDTRFAQSMAIWLTDAGVTPNGLSKTSLVFAVLAGAVFWAGAATGGAGGALLLVLGAAAVQLRLLCNLFDGMVAVEGGRAAPDGAFWNELPDRASDVVIFAGAGLATDSLALGLAAAAMAVLTAYVREFGRAEGAPTDFSGPMAKAHRMAAITLGAVVGAIQLAWTGSLVLFAAALWIVALGTLFTALRRAARLLDWMKTHR